MSNIHIAALFQTTDAAHAARDALVQAGIERGRVLVLDRGHAGPEAATGSPRRLWAALKQVFMPDDDANHYAEAIVRGHPLLVADVTQAEQETALGVLRAAGPINVEAHDEGWRSQVEADRTGEDTAFASPLHQHRQAAGSEGIVGGGVIAGDYGAVGAVHGASVNTDILRGRRDKIRIYQPG